MSDDHRLSPETLDLALRLRAAAVSHINDADVMRTATQVGETFAAATSAADLTHAQAMAVAVRSAIAVGVAAYRQFRETQDDDPYLEDLEAYRAAFSTLVDTGVKEIAPIVPNPPKGPQQ